MIIHFICRGNVLRSLIAETYLKSLRLPNLTVISSGTVTDTYKESDKPFFENTTRLLTEHGLKEYIKLDSEQLTQSRLDSSGLNICLNDRVISDTRNIFTFPENTVVWNIIDIGEGPRTEKYENGREVEEVIYDEIVAMVDALVKTIRWICLVW